MTKRTKKQKVTDWLWTIGTAAASAAVLCYFFPVWVGCVILSVLIAHEFGHTLAAGYFGAASRPPIFVPLGILVIGGSRIKAPDPYAGQFIALAGPIAGAAVALVILVASIIAAMPAITVVAAWTLAWEIFGATFGMDGQKFRRLRNKYRNLQDPILAAS